VNYQDFKDVIYSNLSFAEALTIRVESSKKDLKQICSNVQAYIKWFYHEILLNLNRLITGEKKGYCATLEVVIKKGPGGHFKHWVLTQHIKKEVESMIRAPIRTVIKEWDQGEDVVGYGTIYHIKPTDSIPLDDLNNYFEALKLGDKKLRDPRIVHLSEYGYRVFRTLKELDTTPIDSERVKIFAKELEVVLIPEGYSHIDAHPLWEAPVWKFQINED